MFTAKNLSLITIRIKTKSGLILKRATSPFMMDDYGTVYNSRALPGEASRRRVMYFPAITGSYHPKSETSATPFYHKLAQIKDQRLTGKLNWARLQVKAKKIH